MPLYHYGCDGCGKTTMEFHHFEDIPNTARCECGATAERILGCNMPSSAAWPMWSNAMGCCPDNIPANMERMRKLGCPVEYNPVTGEMKLESDGQRKKALKATGSFCRASGDGL